VKNTTSVAAGRKADPEEQAGKALRQLRLARNWSQQEVAARMTAYGYDFHQTTIAKIEAAQRPLRVRELADFAALYGVGVQELVYVPSRTLQEVEREIEDAEARLRLAHAAAAMAAQDAENARAAARDAENANQAALTNLAVLNGRLDALTADRENLRRLNSSSDSGFEGAGDGATPDVLRSEDISIGAAAEGSPIVLRILLGSHLRQLRESKEITAQQAARALHWALSSISRLELGQISVKEHDLAGLLTFYDVTDAQERLKWLNLAQNSNALGWWQGYYSDILPGLFEPYIGLEATAAEIRIFEAGKIPDLLQTDDYSLAVNSEMYKYYPAKDITARVQLGVTRRERLLKRSNAPYLQVVLDEVVLRRQVGSATVMRDQLKYLAKTAERPNTEIRVLPLTAGTLPAGASFRILHFGEAERHSIVYLEQLTSALYLDKSGEVDTYMDAMRELTSRALPAEETVSFLHRITAK